MLMYEHLSGKCIEICLNYISSVYVDGLLPISDSDVALIEIGLIAIDFHSSYKYGYLIKSMINKRRVSSATYIIPSCISNWPSIFFWNANAFSSFPADLKMLNALLFSEEHGYDSIV